MDPLHHAPFGPENEETIYLEQKEVWYILSSAVEWIYRLNSVVASVQKGRESLHTNQVTQTAEVKPVFCSTKRLGVLLLPKMGWEFIIARYPQHFVRFLWLFACFQYSSVERGTGRIKGEHNTKTKVISF